MAVAVRRISSKKTITLASMDQITTEWLPQEVRNFTSQTALEENRQQVRAGNLPSRVVIDRRSTINLTKSQALALARASDKVTFIGLDSRIQFFYTDNDVLAGAIRYAWNLLRALTRTDTRRGVNTYYIWCHDRDNPGNSRKCADDKAAIAWIARSKSQSLSIRILGPTVEYRRSLIYSPKGRKQQTRWVSPSKAYNEGRATDRYKFTGPTKSKVDPGRLTDSIAVRGRRGRRKGFSAQVAKAIQEIVAQNVNRQFKDLRASYRFVKSKELPLPVRTDLRWRPSEGNEHIPELSIYRKPQHGRRR